jgi:hypothetical protein
MKENRMKVASWAAGLALLSSLATGQALAADGGPLAEQVRAANGRFKDVKPRSPRAMHRSPAPAASMAARWAFTTSTANT